MTAVAPAPPSDKILDIVAANDHPRDLIWHMRAWDEREAKEFGFFKNGWEWQDELVEWLHENDRCLILKARQLGVTWVAAAYAVWQLLFRPGSTVLVYRQKQDDAVDVVRRIWKLYQSLPEHLREHVTVEKPARGNLPTQEIMLRHKGKGELSVVRGMASTSAEGHGSVAALVILDEYARIEAAEEIMKAVTAVAGQRGKVFIISTANGRHNPETGEGNHFHYLWVNAEGSWSTKFLPWSMHPERNQAWYDSSPETRSLREADRMEQYPNNPTEAFTFSQSVYFDKDALLRYADRVREPLYRMVWEAQSNRAIQRRERAGHIRVFEEPTDGHEYAIGADVATGRGQDYSVAYVVDLATMALVCELRNKYQATEFARDLHYLGKWYGGARGGARLAVESGGGWGDPVIIALRDGVAGRPPYPRLYMHRQFSRPDKDEHSVWGFPMNSKTRPAVLSFMHTAIMEGTVPYVSQSLLSEMGDFVHQETGTSPRAADGAHDDCVLAAAIALEMYRQYGEHPDEYKRPSRPRRYQPARPWEAAAA